MRRLRLTDPQLERCRAAIAEVAEHGEVGRCLEILRPVIGRLHRGDVILGEVEAALRDGVERYFGRGDGVKPAIVATAQQRLEALRPRRTTAGEVGGAIAFLLVGFALAAYGLYLQSRADASARWPSTEGMIVSSELQSAGGGGYRPGYSAPGSGPGSLGTTSQPSYFPNVSYLYHVDGVRFLGSRVSYHRPPGVSLDRRSAQEILDRYPVGKKVRVHYDPRAPDTAVLQAGDAGHAAMFLLLALLCVFTATAAVTYVLLRNRHHAWVVSVLVPVVPIAYLGWLLLG